MYSSAKLGDPVCVCFWAIAQDEFVSSSSMAFEQKPQPISRPPGPACFMIAAPAVCTPASPRGLAFGSAGRWCCTALGVDYRRSGMSWVPTAGARPAYSSAPKGQMFLRKLLGDLRAWR